MRIIGFCVFYGEGVVGVIGEKNDEMECCDFVDSGVEGFPGEKKKMKLEVVDLVCHRCLDAWRGPLLL